MSSEERVDAESDTSCTSSETNPSTGSGEDEISAAPTFATPGTYRFHLDMEDGTSTYMHLKQSGEGRDILPMYTNSGYQAASYFKVEVFNRRRGLALLKLRGENLFLACDLQKSADGDLVMKPVFHFEQDVETAIGSAKYHWKIDRIPSQETYQVRPRRGRDIVLCADTAYPEPPKLVLRLRKERGQDTRFRFILEEH